MRLSRDSTCIQGLSWRVETTGQAELERLLQAVAAAGWAEQPGLGELLVYAVPGGHRLLVVPASARVQIRLSYEIDPAQRHLAAGAVFHSLSRLL